MNDNELLRGQGTMAPTLLLGLGGTGSRIVDRIARRAARLPNWESQLRPLTHFVSIDTNHHDQHALSHIPPGNRINIASFDKRTVVEHYRRSGEKQALQWLDPAYKPRDGVKPGAGQIRVESRLGFFYHSPEIRAHLDRLVREALRPGIAWRQNQPARYNVYVFCTLAGGTGSGSFLPAAYLVNSVIRDQKWEPRVIGHLLLSTLLLTRVGAELHSDIHANTYAALKELEHLTKLGYPQVKREGRETEEFVYWRDENRRDVQTVAERPFFLSWIYDRPSHLDLPDIQAAMADGAFLQIFSPILDAVAGELDNYEKNLEGLTRFPGELRDVGLGYSKNFGSFGTATLTLPAEDLLEYSALRFTAQALRSQITFGVDREDPDDDRARALARLAVNYSDPKFLNMGDEGRETAINDAFLASVREMARQDERDDLTEGYWYQLVESVDEGRVTGADDDGAPQRGESRLLEVQRRLEVARQDLLNKISIPKKPLVFPREAVSQYLNEVNRLLEKVREARRIVDVGVVPLESAARDGEVVRDLKLDPIGERYLVLRLLELCSSRWIPAAESRLEQSRHKSTTNPRRREELEQEQYSSLKEAAEQKGLFHRDRAYRDVLEAAQESLGAAADADRNLLAAEVELRQLRELLDFLRSRARQYARLATRMESLVQDLESAAERLRRGEDSLAPPYALRVEVFQTLDEPRRRIWGQVYNRLFVAEGRYLSTFDRATLAETIAAQLKPQVRRDGAVVEKSLDQMVGDLQGALLNLGRQRLRPALFGGAGQPGLDVVSGLEMEAQLILADRESGSDRLQEREIRSYREAKFRSLAHLAGVTARISSAESRALDDGVKVNRTRLLVVGWQPQEGAGADSSEAQLETVLAFGGRHVSRTHWPDPHMVVVHDVELPIPLYYLDAVVGEVEEAYLRLASQELSYHLHTDFNWEKSLPNLNPRRSEVTVGWSLRMLAEGLVTGVIVHRAGLWLWQMEGREEPDRLGESLSGALYSIGEIHHSDSLRNDLQDQLQRTRRELDREEEDRHRQLVVGRVRDLLREIALSERHGRVTRGEALDRPVLKALARYLDEDWKPLTPISDGPRYESLDRR